MKGNTKTSSGGGKAKGDPKVGRTPNQLKVRICEKHREARECQRSRHEANREKRQELARQRDDAKLDKERKREDRRKLANRERLTGKGLFYCESAQARMKEIQRRLSEANREKMSSLVS